MIAEFVSIRESAPPNAKSRRAPNRRSSFVAARRSFFSSLTILASLAGCSDYSATVTPPPAPVTPEGVWTSSASAPAVLGFGSAQLLSGGAQRPATDLFTSSAQLFNLNGVAFDADGTLWVTSQNDSVLVAFSPAALAKGGSAVATTVIRASAGSISGPTGLAFDTQHRLWVANAGNGTLARFDRAALAAGGTPAPSVILAGLANPVAIAFDAAGSIWVADAHKHKIASFTPAQLAASGTLFPNVFLSTAGSSLSSLAGLAFDAHGNLWVASTGNQTVISFTPDQLGATGAPVPHVVLSSHAGSLATPTGLAFDADGSLWVINGDGALEKFTSASLGASGAPEPDVRVSVSGFVQFWSLAFWPRPAGLPLN